MQYKLHCLGFPVECHSDLIGDNLFVVVNTTLPSSKIKKKHPSCSIMCVREAVAAVFVWFGHIQSELNIADIATTPLGPHPFHRVTHPDIFRHLATLTKITSLLTMLISFHTCSLPALYSSSFEEIHSSTNPIIEP